MPSALQLSMATILYQEFEEHWHPVTFWFWKMTSAEKNYETSDQELLTIINCIKHWRHYLKRVQHIITVHSDQNSLQYFNMIKHLNCWQAQWFLNLQKYDFVVIHHFSKINSADASSQQVNYTQAIYKKAKDTTQSDFLTFAITKLSSHLEEQLQLILLENELAQSILTSYRADKSFLRTETQHSLSLRSSLYF